MRRAALTPILVLIFSAFARPLLSASTSPPNNSSIKMSITDNFIELTDTQDRWTLRYGCVEKACKASTPSTPPAPDTDEAHLAVASSDRAFFSHGSWLRWIDTKHGTVIGRWRFPGSITAVAPSGSLVQVAISDWINGGVSGRTIQFDLRNPTVPPGAAQSLLLLRLPLCEFQVPLFTPYVLKGLESCELHQFPTADESAKLIPQLEALTQHDPLSPWAAILLAVTMTHANESRAPQALDRALHVPSDYTEWLPISAFLETFGTPAAADAAFELGYSDLIRRGADPRLAAGIIERLMLYPVDLNRATPARHRALVEHIYRLNPYAEESALAWTSFARAAVTPQERKLWLDRATASHALTTHIGEDLIRQVDLGLLIGIALKQYFVFFLIISYVRYRPQRRADLIRLRENHAPLWKRLTLLNTQYWTMSQRIGIVLVSVLAFAPTATMRQASLGFARQGEEPISISCGDYSGNAIQSFLQNKLPPSPERDFLLALADQQSGDLESAAQLYQHALAYPQSWNNLGVIRRQEGKETDAEAAFRRALQMDPQLHEATFNLTGTPSDEWTRIHQRYAPGTLMLAIPTKSVVKAAFIGETSGQRIRFALRDSLSPAPVDFAHFTPIYPIPKPTPITPTLIYEGALILLFLFALPRMPSFTPPGLVGHVLSILFPGAARRWGILGAPVLVAWFYLLVELFLLTRGAPYPVTFIATTNIARAYGAPSFAPLNQPAWWWFAIPTIAIFVSNYLFIRRERVPQPASAVIYTPQAAQN